MIDFVTVVFSGFVVFEGTTFMQHVKFNKSNKGNLDCAMYFKKTIFRGGANFKGVIFNKPIKFVNVLFKKLADFNAAIFNEDISFKGKDNSNEKEGCFAGGVNFKHAEFRQPKYASFYKVNLAGALFSDVVGLEDVNFTNVRWCNLRDRANAIYDEFFEKKDKKGNIKPKDYSLIAQAYRRLMKNYENAREYSIAGDFYIGAMEMEREELRRERKEFGRDKKIWEWLKKGFHLGFHNMYRWISHYGENYGRPLLCLVGITAVWSVVYCWWVGFPGKQSIAESLRILTFQRWGEGMDIAHKLRYTVATSIQLITTLPFLALFLLALKRRFRR